MGIGKKGELGYYYPEVKITICPLRKVPPNKNLKLSKLIYPGDPSFENFHSITVHMSVARLKIS